MSGFSRTFKCLSRRGAFISSCNSGADMRRQPFCGLQNGKYPRLLYDGRGAFGVCPEDFRTCP